MASAVGHLLGRTGPTLLRGVAIGLIVGAAALIGALEGLERWGINFQFVLRGPILPQTPIVIVSIDEDSFDELDLQWPWPRTLHGQLLDIISRGKPAAVGLDLIFDVPSSRGPEDDLALARAVERAGNVVLGAAITESNNVHGEKTDLNPPIDELFDRAAAIGYVNFDPDQGGFIGAASLTRIFQDAPTPGVDFHLHRLGVRAGMSSAPLPAETTFLINYRGGPKTFRTIPYYQVLNGEVDPETFTRKIVLVGATTPILHDLYPTPFATHGEMSGAEIHANVLETLFQGISVRLAPRGMGLLLILSAGLLAVWLTNRFRPVTAFALIAGATLGYATVAFLSFVWNRLLLEITAVPVTLILGYGATVVENYIQEQRKRALLMHLFSRHVSPEIAEALWQQQDQFLDGGRLRSQKMTVTVLFTDLKGFTPLSEKLDTQALLDWINTYMEVMARLIMEHGGIIDDYAGDSIKADFGVPFPRTTDPEISRDAVNAVNCALAMQREIVQLKKFWQEQNQPVVGTRIGIFTGPVVAGSLGTQQRLKYTTIGDTVNTASRLESFGKDLADPYFEKVPCRILIGEATRRYLGDRFIMQRIGDVSLKGKEQQITVYRVPGRKDEAQPAASLRADIRVNVECAVDITDGEITVHAPTSELSRGGLSVHGLSLKYEKEGLVQLRLTLSAELPPINATAKVAWITDDQAGFIFRDLAPDDQAAIEKFLAQWVLPQEAKVSGRV